MADITLTQAVHRKLRSSLLDDRDLIDGVRQGEPIEIPGQPGQYLCDVTIAVRRPLDPETAELRRLNVTLRRQGEGWEVLEVDGLQAIEESLE